MNPEQTIELTVDPADCPVRLDVYLARALTERTRTQLQRYIDQELVTVDGKPGKAGQKLAGGETLRLTVPAASPLSVEAEELPLSVVFEDEHLLVINKPAGMVVHPGAGVDSGTLVNALLHHCRDSLSGIGGVVRPGIVHRLDKDTSGLIVVAKADAAHHHLSEQIRAKTARREYVALVEGTLPEESGTVDRPIGRHPSRRKQMAVTASGRSAVSHFVVIKRFARLTLLSVALETGRTHQIRVHMASLGFPVVGDLVYNKKATGSLAQRHKLGLAGHALHAARLSFTHPTSGRLLEFEAPLPPDFQRLLDSLS